jgi:hypothetical protein
MAANGISHQALKRDRQDQKLAIASAKMQGKTVATDGTISGSVDSSKPYYRENNTLDITQLPTRYNPTSNTGALVNNSNSAGLLQGRPWSTDGITQSGLVYSYDAQYATSGVTITDISSNTYNGTLVNGTGHDQASSPPAFTFDGADDYIRSPNLYSDIGNPDTFSAGAWVYPTAAGVVLQVAGTATPEQTYFFSSLEFVGAGSPVPNFGLWNGVGITKDTGSALSYNTWYHMVITYNGTTLKGYINGAEVASASVTFDSPHNDGLTVHHLLWGAGSSTNMGDGTYYNGRMNEIRTYSDALTAPEVLLNYNTNKANYGY